MSFYLKNGKMWQNLSYKNDCHQQDLFIQLGTMQHEPNVRHTLSQQEE
jgi:hypothetical protein